MKRTLVIGVALLLLLSVCTATLSVYGTDEPVNVETARETTAARFETMLNNNYAVGDDFSDFDALLESAMIALRSECDEGVFQNRQLCAYLRDFYGICVSELVGEDGATLLPEDGTTVLPPKGFSSYHHTVETMTEQADGTITVWSRVEVFDHDEEPTVQEAVSRFAVSDSRYGYVLLSMELLEIEPAAVTL